LPSARGESSVFPWGENTGSILRKLHAFPGILPASMVTAAGFNPAGVLELCYLITHLNPAGIEYE
jgi:hypothetical protein